MEATHKPLRSLVVEDDFISRCVLQDILSAYGPSDVTVNGTEALAAFQMRLDRGEPYELVCLDIMMPDLNGHEVLREIRRIEQTHHIEGLDAVKVIMTTALNEKDHILSAFRQQCDGYLVKPMTLDAVAGSLRQLELI